jgi:hypothetical protein
VAANVTFSGPLFDGRAAAALAEGVRAVRADLADEAQDVAQEAFATSIRRPTGRFYWSFTSTRVSRTYSTHGGHKLYTMPVIVDSPSTDIVVTSELATYGPWLEGTGSRNVTTRFKGYHGFRKAAQVLQRAALARSTAKIRLYVARCS